MKDFDSSLVHSSWLPLFERHRDHIQKIFDRIDIEVVTPAIADIFRAFTYPLESIRCVIVGQDPYPTQGFAHGLSFSVPDYVSPIPKSLQNIFRELESDLGIEPPSNGNLERWASGGVLLLNRVLSTEIGISNAHSNFGWQKFTNAVARSLGDRDVVAVLWGRQAQELSMYFKYRVESAHPSPLSSYRGFFGSKPFSKVNNYLAAQGREPISW